MSRCRNESAMSANTELSVRDACATMSRSTLPYSSTSRQKYLASPISTMPSALASVMCPHVAHTSRPRRLASATPDWR